MIEHYYQTPYGVITVDQTSYLGDYDGDGLVELGEWDTNSGGTFASGDTCFANYSGDCRLADFDDDRDIDASDATTLGTLVSSDTYRQPGHPYSGIGNRRAHQGLILDPEVMSYNNRARQYASALARFTTSDPLATQPWPRMRAWLGPNHYDYVGSAPAHARDPSGRATMEWWPTGNLSCRPPNTVMMVPCESPICCGNGNQSTEECQANVEEDLRVADALCRSRPGCPDRHCRFISYSEYTVEWRGLVGDCPAMGYLTCRCRRDCRVVHNPLDDFIAVPYG